MFPGQVIGFIILFAVVFALAIALAAAWTAIWLAFKIVATVVALPPALVLSECCNCQGPKEAVFKVVRLKWDWWVPEDWDKDETVRKGPVGPQQSTSARMETLHRARAASSPNEGPGNTAATHTSSPAERDVERGIPERDPAGCPPPPPPSDMDIADSNLGEPAPPSYQNVQHPEEPPPEYEQIESRRHVWG
ncbi:hypothetical protein PG996_015175 [Apiospora saccharicola]|uniref:Uncharacterized protein n=1 Tax=Apiospora saccharicola TaxID=335842 RepID=A0ABR1TKD2_9PEZI